MSYCDIRGAIPELIGDLKPADNDNAVCAVLRWAKRTSADVVDVSEACAELGLDLSGALQRARSETHV